MFRQGDNGGKGNPFMGVGIALGVAIGVSLGTAMGNLAAGIGIGIAIGVLYGVAVGRHKAKQDRDDIDTRDDR